MVAATRKIEWWKLGANGMKWLKISHIFLSILFFGGILSSFTLSLGLDLTNFANVYATYQSIMRISDNIIRYGGFGNLLLGLVYGAFTTWGFFKHKWLTVKWIIFVAQTLVGIVIVDGIMVSNMRLLEAQGAAALHNPVFLHDHYLRQAVVMVQIGLTIFILIVSGLKPWRNKKKA
ncbi:MAG: hypothetical protein U0350_32930 [Caldilineaceae bacterium]